MNDHEDLDSSGGSDLVDMTPGFSPSYPNFGTGDFFTVFVLLLLAFQEMVIVIELLPSLEMVIVVEQKTVKRVYLYQEIHCAKHNTVLFIMIINFENTLQY